MKFVHTGDIHLGLQFKSLSFDRDKAMARREELWTSLQRIVEYTVHKKKDFLFIAGDLFENKYFTLGDMKRLKEIFKEADPVNIIIAAGNHDYIGNKSLYKKIEWPGNTTIFDSSSIQYKEFPDLKTRVYGYSWDRPEIREEKLLDGLDTVNDEYNNILIIHGDLAQNSNYLPLKLDRLKDLEMDYIALGHIHKPEILNNNIAYCGCPEPLHFGEAGERGFIEGSIKNKITEIKFIPFSKRRFILSNIEINERMTYQDIFNKILDIDLGEKDKDFYRISLDGLVQNHIDMENLVRSVKEYFYHVEIIDRTRPDYDLEILERTYEDNIVGMYIRAMKDKGIDDPQIKDSLYIGLDALLRGRSK